MKKVSIRHLKRKEPLSKKLRRAATNKLTLLSVAFLLTGLILIQLSYSYTDVIVTPNIQTYNPTVSSNSTSSVLTYQHYNLTEDITFSMAAGNQVNYTLYKYNVYTDSSGNLVHKYLPFRDGIATNNTVLHLSRMYLLQGQSYYLNMTSGSGNTFQVEVQTIQNVTLIEHTAKNLGAPGIGIVMGSAILMAYAITRELDVKDIRSSRT